MDKSENLLRAAGLWAIVLLFVYSIALLCCNPSGIAVYGFGNLLQYKPFFISSKIFNTIFITLFFIINFLSFLSITQKLPHIQYNKKNVFKIFAMTFSGYMVCVPLAYLTLMLAGFVLKRKQAIILIIINIIVELAIDIFAPDVKTLKVMDIFQENPIDQIVVDAISTICFQIFAYLLGIVLAKDVKQRADLELANAELKALNKMHDASVRMSERVYISRELHDSIGHHLVAINTNLQLANTITKETDVKEAVEDAYSVSKQLLSEVREIVSSLRYSENINLKEAIEEILKPVKSPKIEFLIEDNLNFKDPALTHTLFRCVQEIITNTLKHSDATNLRISIYKVMNKIILSACDNGKGIVGGISNLKLSNGLRGMRERVQELSGSTTFSTELNKGFSTYIEIPYIGEKND